MVHIRPSLPGDSWLVLGNLRQAEVDELQALGVTSEESLRLGMAHGESWTVFINGEPAGIYGISEHGTYRVPWAVFSRTIDRHPVPFLRACRRWVQSLKGPALQFVDARNERAVKWFEWMGFKVSDPIRYGINGEFFRQVWVN